LMDVYFVPFGSNIYKYWIGQPCPGKHYFVCVKLMDGKSVLFLCFSFINFSVYSDVRYLTSEMTRQRSYAASVGT
jgi:hypothetical protein